MSCPSLPASVKLSKYAKFRGSSVHGYRGVVAFRRLPWVEDETTTQFRADPLSNFWESPVTVEVPDSGQMTFSCAEAAWRAILEPVDAKSFARSSPRRVHELRPTYTPSAGARAALLEAIRAKYAEGTPLGQFLSGTAGLYLLCIDDSEQFLSYLPSRRIGGNLLGMMLMHWRDTPGEGFNDKYISNLPEVMYNRITDADMELLLGAPYMPMSDPSPPSSPPDDLAGTSLMHPPGAASGSSGSPMAFVNTKRKRASSAPDISHSESGSPMSTSSPASSSPSATSATRPRASSVPNLGSFEGPVIVSAAFKPHERNAIRRFPLRYDNITKIECGDSKVVAFYGNLRADQRMDRMDEILKAPFFGNFWPAIVSVDVRGISRTFRNAEAAFQALKINWGLCVNEEEYEGIIKAFEGADGQEAWNLRNEHKHKAKGDHIVFERRGHIIGQREFIMDTVLKAKFTLDNEFGRIHMDTGDDILVEYKPNVWPFVSGMPREAPYWHTDQVIHGDKADGNALGLFLMIRRAELRDNNNEARRLGTIRVLSTDWEMDTARYVNCIKTTLTRSGIPT